MLFAVPVVERLLSRGGKGGFAEDEERGGSTSEAT